jgi:translation initiation factor 1
MSKRSKKDRTGIVYSTNPDFEYEYRDEIEEETLPPDEQQLRVYIEKKGRKGKPVCIVTGFVGTADDLSDLARTLKTKCGVGGSAKDGEIILQGTMKNKVVGTLVNLGYKAK